MPDVYQRVIKRDGKEVAFDQSKIENAIRKSNAEVDPVHQLSDAQIEAVVDMLTEQINDIQHAVNVEDIQDMVEKGIMSVRGYEVAQKYVRYRYKRELARRANTTDQNILSLINLSNEELKQENSNKNPIINSTQRDYIAGETSKDLTARVLLPKDIWEAHEQGIIHFHDADYFLQSEHNCFHRKERFVTKDGVRSFKDCSDGEKVSVLDKDGVWREATVHKYGKQLMQRVVFTAGRSTKEVICTSNHRWILSDGSVTTNLSVGDSLINLPKAEHVTTPSKDIDKAFCLGFVIGDGTDTAKGTKVRLCGAKNRYVDTFKRAGWRANFQKSLNGDAECNISKQIKQRFLDSQGWEHMSYEQKVALFEGYYAADGATMSNGVCTSDERVLNMIKDISALAGYHVSSVKEIIHDTNFKKDAKLFSVKFRKKQNNNNHWIVKSIEPYRKDLEYEAWCVEEPVTHTFTLDGGMVTGNCDLIALDDMLQNGTVISGTLIEKPHSFYTACNVTTQIIAQVASNQYGGQSFSLAHLAPFVQVSRDKIRQEVINEREQCAEKLDRDIIDQIVKIRLAKEITAGIQTIQYQLITLMTCNGQAPFVTMWMYLDEVPEGRIRDDLAMLIEEVLSQRIQGTKNEQGVWVTPAFPKLIYALDEDNIRPGTKYWDLTLLAAKCTAKRMVPDYISVKKMKEYKNGDVYPCMGCRSFLTPDTVGLNPDGTHKYYGRFNCGVVTINLVDVACSSYGDMRKFWEILEDRLELCHRALQCKHERLRGTLSDVAPILWQHGAIARLKKGETIDKLLYNNYSTISLGYAGLYEMCVRMTGKSHTSEEGKAFALAVMQKLNDKCAEWRAAENISYSVYGTPMETTTYKFAKCLQKRFGIIKDVTDHNYITNSYHISVREEIDAYSKLKFESEFQKLSPGGAISYVEVPNLQNNIPAVVSVMQFIYDNIMYAELNTKSDYCSVCGFDGEIQIVDDHGKLVWECPNCGNRDESKMSVTRRTCGYLGSQYWNQGRTAEIRDRVLHL